MEILQLLLVLSVGGVAGVITGLMGASGVMAVVPGMMVLGFTVHQAIGASLAVDMTASLVVTGTYMQKGRVELRQGLWIALAAVVGAQVGGRFSVHIPAVDLSHAFAFILLGTAVLMWRNGTARTLHRFQHTHLAEVIRQHSLVTSLVVGLFAGVYCGIFGAGGGSLFLVTLLLLGYSLHQAVGTSTMIMALTTASGTLSYAMQGQVPYLAVGGVAAGTVLGSFVSSQLANQLDEERLTKIIALVLALLGIVMLASQLLGH